MVEWPYFQLLSEEAKTLIFRFAGPFYVGSDEEDFPDTLPWSECVVLLQEKKRELADAPWLCKRLQTGNPNIVFVDIAFQNLSYSYVSEFTQALRKSKTLQTLTLRNNTFDTTEMQMLLTALTWNKSVNTLEIVGEKAFGNSLEILAAKVGKNRVLQHIRLVDCNLRDCNASSLAIFLSSYCALETVDLSYNDMSDYAVNILSNALQLNETIKVLKLDYNSVGPVGVQHFLSMLRLNTALKTLSLSRNPLGKEGIEAIDSWRKEAKASEHELNRRQSLINHTMCFDWDHVRAKNRMLLF
mmetsp:Transcript_2960/g.3506  ORF Transcript_2960/g.3506 Transcript_2960/m.3506 type:complete len:299 (+) Transcript_2960:204-1100(+)